MLSPRRTTPGPARGFTLVELVATTAIVAILAAVSLVAITPASEARRAAAAAELVRLAQFARGHATATGLRTTLTVDTGAQRVTLAHAGSAPGAPAVALHDPAGGRDAALTLSTGPFAGVRVESVAVPGGGSAFGFDWRGRPVDGAGTLLTSDVVITLSGGRVVSVAPRSGLAGIQ